MSSSPFFLAGVHVVWWRKGKVGFCVVVEFVYELTARSIEWTVDDDARLRIPRRCAKTVSAI
jgi:hypothetical protein